MTLEDAIKHAKEVARENRYRIKHVLFHNNDIDEINACIECAEEHEQLAIWLAELKRYKELKENGRLIELPCAVGDTVYCLAQCAIRGELTDNFFINEIQISSFEFDRQLTLTIYDLDGIDYTLDDIFLTKEEAEAKLKEAGEQND